MGSTVSTNKQAYAFKTPEDKTAYVLFEESYEKNCYPHTPSWCCRALGYLDEVMGMLFRNASSCEGGMLQHASGHVLPETYLQRWFDTMANPLAMPDVTNVMKFSESSYATLPFHMKKQIEDSLQSSGMDSEVDTLDGREVSLHKDFDLLRAIYGKCPIGPWRFLANNPFNSGNHRKDLGYAPTIVMKNPTFTPPKMARCGPENVFIAQENGEYKNGGWAYSVVGNFVCNYVTAELENPGSFKSAFKTFRKSTETAEQLSESTQIEITVPALAENNDYERSKARNVVNMFAPGQNSVTVTLGQVLEKEKTKPDDIHALYDLLNCDSARWFPASGVKNETVQLELEIA